MANLIEIPPKSGHALTVKEGQIVRLIDLDGQQVSDFVCFNEADRTERFSQAKTRLNNWTIHVTTGHTLYSNRDNAMFAIVGDTVGIHDTLLAACNRSLYENYFKVGPRNGCLENLAIALEPFGIAKDDIPDPFNPFTNLKIREGGRLEFEPPLSKPGDHLDMRAEMDCLVGITACAEDITVCNAGVCTRIGVEVL
ncbi:MAG: DUF1989 domain-containing protein [Actinomycetota bacterium]